MHLNPGQELLLWLVTFLFSIVGGITGIGIATIIIPIFLLLGSPLPFAKAVALWINVWIMLLSVYKRWNQIRWNLAIPLVITSFISAPLGAKISFFIPEKIQLFLLATVVILSSLFILFLKPKPLFEGTTKSAFIRIGLLLGTFAGFLGGMLGIGGGILVNPTLIILGFDPLMVTSVSAVMVLFSSFSGWLTYTLVGYFSLISSIPFAIAAVGGSYIGNHLAVKIPREITRKIVAFFALAVGIITYIKAFTMTSF